MSKSSVFASDNAAGVHTAILQAMNCANAGFYSGYGDDPYTERTQALFKQQFGSDAQVFPVLTGTAANVICLKSVCRSYEAVLCAQSAHLQHHECGAPEALLGSKLILIPDREGKLTPEAIQAHLVGEGVVHYVQPRVVSISQCTEWGTLYTLDEIAALSAFCRTRQLLLHMDGARLANAAAALNCSFKEMVTDTGVDLLSFGGTKCGCMGAEAVVVLRPEIANATPFLRKQCMHLMSKMRFVSAQLNALLEDDLWKELASHANAMAKKLAAALAPIQEVRLAVPVETNALFTRLPSSWLQPIQQRYSIVVWDAPTTTVRWMTSYATTEGDVQELVSTLTML